MLDAGYSYTCLDIPWYVSACFVTNVNPAKTDESIEVAFGGETQVGTRNHG